MRLAVNISAQDVVVRWKWDQFLADTVATGADTNKELATYNSNTIRGVNRITPLIVNI